MSSNYAADDYGRHLPVTGGGCFALGGTAIIVIIAIPLVIIGSIVTWYFLSRGGLKQQDAQFQGTLTCQPADLGVVVEVSWPTLAGKSVGRATVDGTVTIHSEPPGEPGGAPTGEVLGSFPVRGSLENGEMVLEPGLSDQPLAWTRATGQLGEGQSTFEAFVESESCTALSTRQR